MTESSPALLSNRQRSLSMWEHPEKEAKPQTHAVPVVPATLQSPQHDSLAAWFTWAPLISGLRWLHRTQRSQDDFKILALGPPSTYLTMFYYLLPHSAAATLASSLGQTHSCSVFAVHSLQGFLLVSPSHASLKVLPKVTSSVRSSHNTQAYNCKPPYSSSLC